MSSSPDILDPYGVPRDEAAKEAASAVYFSRGTGSRLLRLVLVGVIVLGTGFFYVHHQKVETQARLVETASSEQNQASTVDVITVQSAAPTHVLSLPGETAAWDETTIYARVNGYVAKWFVDIGDHVAAGQKLAAIDTPELDAELLAAKAKLNASVAQVAVKEAQADFAKTTDERWRESPKGVVSDQERESKKAASAEAVAELNAARAQVMLEQADVDRLTALTQFKEVRAPFDGTIVQRHIDTGNLVTAGSTANTTSLYQLSQDNPIRIFVHAPQDVAAQLMHGDIAAIITGSGQPSFRLEGKVTRTAKAIDPESRTLRVEVDVPNPSGSLVPGMYVQAAFNLRTNAPVEIPAAALLFRSSGPQVAVINNKGIVAFKDVTIASDDGNVVAIGSGLTAGDKVALNLSSQIAAGDRVMSDETNRGETKSASTQ